ncbi:hypothetical protein ACXJJ3_18490 [Kribbella sp. WER1]
MIVFPIGHYHGIRDDEQVVRVGWSQHRLDADAFAIWVLAHGVPEVGKGAWTVDDLLVHAEKSGVEEPAAYVERLADAGLLAVVTDAREFARRYRMDVMFVGLGNTPDRLEGHAIGIPGLGTAAVLDPESYELWQWGSVAPTVWHSCEVRATVSAEPSARPDPEAALAEILGDLRFLVARGCAYLDVAG